MEWHKDKGKTLLPCLYIPFNEVDDVNNAVVPIRTGDSYMTYRNTNKTIDDYGHVFFEQDDAIVNSGRYAFGTPDPANPTSRHDLILSPHLNIGKFIVTSFVVKWGQAGTAFANFKNLFWYGLYTGFGGYNLEVSELGVLRQFIWLNNGVTTGVGGLNASSAAGMCPKNTWLHVFQVWEIVSATQMKIRIYVADLNGTLKNGGNPVLSRTVDGPVPNMSIASTAHYIGYEGGLALDIRDYLAIVSPEDPINSLIGKISTWYKSASNKFKFPDFLRDKPVKAATTKKVEFYHSTWTISGQPGKNIVDMYPLVKRYCYIRSSAAGFLIGLSPGAFTKVAGVYLKKELRDFCIWLGKQGFKFKVLVFDQTYNDPEEVPAHMPYWVKKSTNSSNNPIDARVIPYWDEWDTFDVVTEVFNNPDWPTYNAARATSGTYRYFHYIYHVVDAVADLPNFAGITTGETSGQAIGSRDRANANNPGVSNRAGIYGITNGAGVYQTNKTYSMTRQTIAQGKIMQMVAGQLQYRPDVMKSIQINFFRASMGGSAIWPYYTKATKTFTSVEGKAHGYLANDAMFLWKLGSPANAIAAGVELNRCYYVVNPQEFSYQLALTPGGAPIEFSRNITAGEYMYFCPINQWQEQMVDDSRGSYNYDGVILSDQTRQLRVLAESMHAYGFVTSGPDVLASELEKPIFYVGPYADNTPGQWSVVEARLAMQKGTGIFKGLALGNVHEVQMQESWGGNERDQWFDAMLPNFAPFFQSKYSLEQAIRYAVERQQVNSVVLFVTNSYAQKFWDAFAETSRY